MASHTGKSGSVAAVIALGVVAVVLALGIVGIIVLPEKTADIVRPLFPELAAALVPAKAAESEGRALDAMEAKADADLSTEAEEEVYRQAHLGRPKVYPLVAQCSDIDLRSPIAPADLTAVLFHQASYEYALVMTTELPSADMEAIGTENPARVNHGQIEGDWLDCEAMHLWRTGDTTAMDTSIDIGATAGTKLRSPVTGTVVLVRDYMLYEETPDVEIHIQPEGRPDLDVVLIHTENPLVKAGDKVEAGVTDLAHVRDIATPLVDVQLYFYSPGDDPGNHAHVQVNDANYRDYREKRLAGAITV